MIKKIVVILSILTLFLSVIVFAQKKSPLIGIAIYRYDDNFMAFVRRDIERLMKGKANLVIRDSYNSQATQNDLVDAMISRGANVLAINLVNPQAAQSIIDKAMEKNIPVVFFNKEPDKSAMDSYNKVWYIGTKSEDAGNMQGKIILDDWKKNPNLDKNKDGKMQYVLLKGEPGHKDANARSKYSIDYINNNGVKTQALEESSAMWEKSKAKDMMKSWMSKYGDKIEYIICNNDAMALGVLAAIQELGYNKGDPNKYIPIVGVDGIPECLIEIKNGNIAGTVLQSPIDQAKAVVDISLNVSSGKNPAEGTDFVLDEVKAIRLPYVPITKNNISVAEAVYK